MFWILGLDDVIISIIGMIGILVISYWLKKIYRRIRQIAIIVSKLYEREDISKIKVENPFTKEVKPKDYGTMEV